MANQSNTTPAVDIVPASALETIAGDELSTVTVKPQLLREVVLGLQANLHQSNANTKRRGEVRGGGKKPWRQKGTGRARVGSSRNPIWRGGGVAFGPLKTKNYHHQPTADLRRQALAGAVRLKIQTGHAAVWNLNSPITKTKSIIQKLPVLLTIAPILVVVPSADFKIGLRNLPNLRIVTLPHLNALNVTSARQMIFVNNTFDQLKTKLTA